MSGFKPVSVAPSRQSLLEELIGAAILGSVNKPLELPHLSDRQEFLAQLGQDEQLSGQLFVDLVHRDVSNTTPLSVNLRTPVRGV
jgi:hypothetical protein